MIKELPFRGPRDLEATREMTKLSTLRESWPKVRSLLPGPAVGIFKMEKSPPVRRDIVITHNYESSLQNTRWIQLATDGWIKPSDALSDLQRYYHRLTIDSPVVAITFILDSLHRQLEDQGLILSDQDIDIVARDPRTRPIFLKSICATAVLNKMSAEEYLILLHEQRIMTTPEKEKVFEHWDLIKTINNAALLQDVIDLGKNDPRYRTIVLAGLADS